METLEKQHLSIYYWLKELMPESSTNPVTVTGEFPSGNLNLPTVSVLCMKTYNKPFELGGRDLNERFWRIDVFAQNISTRDGLAYLIYDSLETKRIVVYNYEEGFPPAVSPTAIGYLIVTSRLLTPVHVFDQLVEKLYWRTSISFYTYYEQI